MKKFSALILIVLLSSSCTGRIPSPTVAHKSVTKYFQKYGKKYKESDFGKHPVQKVEIVKVEGIQKDLAQAEAYTYLQEGPVYWVRVILQKKTFGWKSISWEKLGAR